jgi:hypothetical protein
MSIISRGFGGRRRQVGAGLVPPGQDLVLRCATCATVQLRLGRGPRRAWLDSGASTCSRCR